MDVDSERVEEAASLPGGPAVLDTPERILLRDTLDADLQAALDALPDAFREAVWLRDVEEFSYAEIAEMLGVPIGTVMSRISRGRRLLFQELNGKEKGKGPLRPLPFALCLLTWCFLWLTVAVPRTG